MWACGGRLEEVLHGIEMGLEFCHAHDPGQAEESVEVGCSCCGGRWEGRRDIVRDLEPVASRVSFSLS